MDCLQNRQKAVFIEFASVVCFLLSPWVARSQPNDHAANKPAGNLVRCQVWGSSGCTFDPKMNAEDSQELLRQGLHLISSAGSANELWDRFDRYPKFQLLNEAISKRTGSPF